MKKVAVAKQILLYKFKMSVKKVDSSSFKVAIVDGLEKKLSDQQKALVADAVAKAKAQPKAGGLLGRFM